MVDKDSLIMSPEHLLTQFDDSAFMLIRHKISCFADTDNEEKIWFNVCLGSYCVTFIIFFSPKTYCRNRRKFDFSLHNDLSL